jgi:RNA polymerase sigma-70 factor, ECF subfamily
VAWNNSNRGIDRRAVSSLALFETGGDGQRVTERSGDRNTDVDEAELGAALAGDPEAFGRLTERYTRELHLHCYRMLGSYHDAEDGVQETMLRAWRHLASFEGRSSFRAWLYRIATNVCLTRRIRQPKAPLVLPRAVEAIARSPEAAIGLSPYPDALLDELEATSGDPVADYDLRESVQLAFLAVVQLLPPRQRAVLILHDVVGFSAGEVAQLLDATLASVNSALNRARATIAQQRQVGRLQIGRTAPTDDIAQSLVRRYVEAWQAVDISNLVGLLKSDVLMTMPPLPMRYDGREAVIRFLVSVSTRDERDRFRFIPTRANRQPGLAVYRARRDDATYRAWGIFVLTADGDSIAEITAFIDPTLMPAFGLPTELVPDSGAGGQR